MSILISTFVSNMALIIEILMLIALLAIYLTLREILHFARLAVFKLARPEPAPATPKGPKARRTLKF